MKNIRKIYIVVAGGNPAAERHFEDTIQKKRTLKEVRQFLPDPQIKNLEQIYHDSPFIVWGSVPGPLNETRWNRMEPGDIVLINNRGRIKFAGEVAATVRSKELARYFWRENDAGATWELMYFIVNEERTNVSLSKLNPLFGYAENYAPRGFTMINENSVANFARHYGDILGVLKTFEKGENIIEIKEEKKLEKEVVEEKIEKAPTEHTEMQWRLIRLGKLAKFDVWVPRNDQSKQFEDHKFTDFVLREFHDTLDVPPTIKNIDVVWKFGPYSIMSAFEIENTTQVFSGLLRLADLRADSPNSNYPLFIVAPEDKKRKVFDELRRPTFSARGLRMNDVVRYVGYKTIREIDESFKDKIEFDADILFKDGERIE
jgi:hypothetical protein